MDLNDIPRHFDEAAVGAMLKRGRMRSARTVSLIEVVVLEGDGTTDSIAREVTYYFTADGAFVAISDKV